MLAGVTVFAIVVVAAVERDGRCCCLVCRVFYRLLDMHVACIIQDSGNSHKQTQQENAIAHQ